MGGFYETRAFRNICAAAYDIVEADLRARRRSTLVQIARLNRQLDDLSLAKQAGVPFNADDYKD